MSRLAQASRRLNLEALEDRTMLSTCHVTRLSDAGIGMGFRGDLRFCINKVNTNPGGDDIDFHVTGTINLTGALPDLASDIDIQGPGVHLLTIDANQHASVFYVEEGVNVAIASLTITGGLADAGGGIYNEGNLEVRDSLIFANALNEIVGGDSYGGGIYNDGSLLLWDSEVSANVTDGFRVWGGGIYNKGDLEVRSSLIASNTNSSEYYSGGASGAGISNFEGQVTILNSTLLENSSNCGGAGWGGAIHNRYGDITIQNSIVSGNSVDCDYAWGGAISNGGSGSGGTITVLNSSVTDNTATGIVEFAQGGGIFNTASIIIDGGTLTNNSAIGGDGGGIMNDNSGELLILSSTISGNLAYDSAAFGSLVSASGGGIRNEGTITIHASTISGNTARVEGNAPVTYVVGGGGFANGNGILMIHNSTVTENLLDYPGTLSFPMRGGGIHNTGALLLTHSTIARNSASNVGYGGGIDSGAPGSTSHLSNTIVALNIAQTGPDYRGFLTTSTHNIFGNATNVSGYASTDVLDINPLLDVLADNGGPTLTIALLPGSPAIDAGDNTDAPDFDQRGPGFPRIVNGTIDIGAFEVQSSPIPRPTDNFAVLLTADLGND